MSTVHAAGALVWRLAPTGVQVLLIHRPQYDDWSWPKGKPKKKEPLPVCALREVQEETGVPIVLGIPLPAVTYDLSTGEEKVNHYWAARVAQDETFLHPRPHVHRASEAEIDDVRWVDVLTAWSMLTRRADREPLKALIDAHADGYLDSAAVLLTEHTSHWKTKKQERLNEISSAFGVTLAPRHSHLSAPNASGKKIRHLVGATVKDTYHSSLLTAHPGALPQVVDALKGHTRKRIRHTLRAPAPGKVLTLYVATRPGKKKPRIVAFDHYEV